MKTRMRRFWISVSLAAGSLALPLSGSLRAHDLPTRWTSGANSTPSWNYLLDDCLDTPMLPGPELVTDLDSPSRRGTEDWASSCPVEWAAGASTPARSASMDIDGLFRNPISRFSKEMTCWVNEWHMLQYSQNRMAQPNVIWALQPDIGNPPTPDYGMQQLANLRSIPLVDTCAFDAEYQARQTAAELLAKEIARAAEVARFEAQLSQALADASQAEAVIKADAIPDQWLSGSAYALSNREGRSALCGGADQEIISMQCFPNRYAPGITDEYLAYDLDARDHHWLGGLGKSWKLRSALGGSAPLTLSINKVIDQSVDAEDAWAVPADEADSAPESFVAPDLIAANDFEDDSTPDEAVLNAYLNGMVHRAQMSAAELMQSSSDASASLASQEIMPNLLPGLSQTLAIASDWVEDQQCRIAAELCGFDSAYRVGGWIADQSLVGSQATIDSLIAMGHYLDVPADTQSGLDVYVIYVDAEGNSLAVPSSLARAWNRPEPEIEPATFASTSDEFEAAGNDWAILEQAKSTIAAMLAKQLDSIGMRMLQVSDVLSHWADTQIASRDESSVR